MHYSELARHQVTNRRPQPQPHHLIDLKSTFALTLMLAIYFNLLVSGYYLPYRRSRSSSDPDDDLMDRDASYDSPQDNREGRGTDEEPDNDGSYGETPRDEDNQADLEKFFDDHLGASEKDGMDNENLPTNAIPFILTNPSIVTESEIENSRLTSLQEAQSQLCERRINRKYPDASGTTRNRLTVLCHGPIQKLEGRSSQPAPNRYLDPEDDTVAYKTVVKNEDVDRDQGNFMIPDLGGYDPEEDFRQQLHDMNQERPNINISDKDIMDVQASGYDSKDIAFDSGPTNKEESVFHDGTEDPDVDNLPAGVESDQVNEEQASSEHKPEQPEEKPGQQSELSESTDQPDDDVSERVDRPDDDVVADEPNNGEKRLTGDATSKGAEDRSDADSDEGSWVDDGIDDIEIPAQSQQDEASNQEDETTAPNEAPDGGGGGQPDQEASTNPQDRASSPNDESEEANGGSANQPDGHDNQSGANQGDNRGSSQTDHYHQNTASPYQGQVYEEAGVRHRPAYRREASSSNHNNNKGRGPNIETPSKWTNDMHKAWEDESQNEWPGPPPLED